MMSTDSKDESSSVPSKQNNIGDVKDAFYNSFCPGICENVKGFKSGGYVMAVFGAFSMVAIFFNGALHVLAVFGRYWMDDVFWVWINVPTVLWLLGTIIYGGLINISSIDDTKGSASNIEVKEGVGLCIFLVLFHVVVNVHAIIFTRKAFRESNPS